VSVVLIISSRVADFGSDSHGECLLFLDFSSSLPCRIVPLSSGSIPGFPIENSLWL